MCRLPSRSKLFLCIVSVALAAVGGAARAPAGDLQGQPSAYLAAQAASPVQWTTWGDAAFARAKAQHRPVFLHIGSFVSELDRAMMRQSFSNVDTAKFLNDTFVCVLVDAKERPDIAALYQNYLQAAKQLTGLPMNIWLTPDLKPFEGANYLPPTEEWGKEGFITIAKRTATAWATDAAAQGHKANEAVATVVAAQKPAADAAAGKADLAAALKDGVDSWQPRFDAAHGGFGDPPKHPEPELLRFLLRTPATRDFAVTTLKAIATGAIHDPLDGGFYRSVTDAEWHQPYFQKLLLDQPRIALAFLDAAKLTGDKTLAEPAREALQFALTRLALPGGDYVAAEDATLEDVLPSQLWTYAEITAVLGDKAGAEFAKACGATEPGNLADDAIPGVTTKGKNILYRATPLGDATAEKALALSAEKLREVRAKRPAPRRDDATPAAAHGLMLAALARAGAELPDAALAKAAAQEFSFIRTHLLAKDGGLLGLAGRTVAATPADYAGVLEGLAAYAAVAKTDATALAEKLRAQVNAKFWDAPSHRYFATLDAQAGFWARVHAAAPVPGDPATQDAAMLIALEGLSGDRTPATDLVMGLISDAKAATDAPARGDTLLALQLAQDSAK